MSRYFLRFIAHSSENRQIVNDPKHRIFQQTSQEMQGVSNSTDYITLARQQPRLDFYGDILVSST